MEDYKIYCPRPIQGIYFSTYNSEEIKKLSTLEITNVEILDMLGHPAKGGLHDTRLGPNDHREFCETCHLNYFQCPGHVGHISLPLPVFNPVLLPRLYQILRGSCFHCHRLLAPPIAIYLTLYQLQVLEYGLVSAVQDLADVASDVKANELSQNDSSIICMRLKAKFEESIKGLKYEEAKHSSLVKSVVDCRRNIIKSFTKRQMMGITGKCPHCKMPRFKIALRYNSRFIVVEGKKNLSSQSLRDKEDNFDNMMQNTQQFNTELTALDVREHMRLLWKNDQEFLQHLYKILYFNNKFQELSIDMFFMDNVLVTPSKFRQLIIVKGSYTANPQTLAFNEILKDCIIIRNLKSVINKVDIKTSEMDSIKKLPGNNEAEKLLSIWFQLQKHVNDIFDTDLNKVDKAKGMGVKQIMEKKEGLFRKNMMGKRVNYAARSVISPDPYIMVDEVGIPLVFATKLTFPEPVAHWNLERLRIAVTNGPKIHPGASFVELEDGKIIKLSDNEENARRAIANTLLTPSSRFEGKHRVKKVHRHLRNGDILLMNRQPTLHKPSMMGHKARVLPGEKTLRLHYANCKSYNADFDGDEMNAHFPQSFLSQAEGRHILNVNRQYLVPKDGTPLSGLIQDHIIAGTLLTIRGRFFSREDYHKLLYSAISFKCTRLKLLPPSIIKPKQLWSGKQIVSSLILNLIPEGCAPLNLEGKAKISPKNWQKFVSRPWMAGGDELKGDNMTESEIIIKSGELLCGVIDKAQVGPTPHSLIHFCYELYGGETSALLLTALARLFTHYLQYHSGFSLGIEDIVLTREASKQRRKIMKSVTETGIDAYVRAFSIPDHKSSENFEELSYNYKEAHFDRDDTGLKLLDFEMKKVTDKLNNAINDICIPTGLRKKFPENNLQLMVLSGAKGSSVNTMQISCLLGQIELEGRRMPLMLNGCTLPSFLPYDMSPRAGGFVDSRFLSGVNPQEYFFHCMAGREGLIDTAVKTSRSGYLQRCLIKHLEGIVVNYDLTVRDSDGSIIQFLYGEDGLDVSKMQLLKQECLPQLAKNYFAAMKEEEMDVFLKRQIVADPNKMKKKVKRWKEKHSNKCKPLKSLLPRISPFLLFSSSNISFEPYNDKKIKEEHVQQYRELDPDTLKNYRKKTERCPDPVNSILRPDLAFGSISEKLDSLINDYINKNPHGLLYDENFQTDAINIYQKSTNFISKEKFKNLSYFRAMKALAEPGEPVGLLAAQSIGEPSTQMTLNTFHFAGKGEMNVTLGIPRLREILMTASANIAISTMDLPLLDGPDIEKKAEKLRLKLSPVPLKEVLDNIIIKEVIAISTKSMNSRIYYIKMDFLEHKEYQGILDTSPSQILHYIENVFIKKIIVGARKKINMVSNIKLVESTKAHESSRTLGSGEEEESIMQKLKTDDGESSGESDGDGDATAARSKMCHDQDLEYEDPEDDEIQPDSDNESELQDIEIKQEVRSSDENENIPAFISKKLKKKIKNITPDEKAKRINYVKGLNSWILSYDFDVKRQIWCEFSLQLNLEGSKIDIKTLIEDEVNKALVRSVHNIEEAILARDPNNSNKKMLKTKGVNFLEIFKYDNIIDINKIYSNNIQEIAKIYGIEAAAKVIIKEIVNVFATYGITVDPHHLSLVADYMTSSGFYRPCNRIGMESNASPLQQMTFETTKNYMVEAMLMGSEDRLKSPSANIIAGQLVKSGTGCFDVICTRINNN